MHNIDNDIIILDIVKTGLITVSKTGEVYNTKTKRFIGAMSSNGYRKISYFNGYDEFGCKIVINVQIHRLVWLVYNGLINEGYQINHIDGNKLNNSLTNLELTTPSDNAKHAIENGLHTSLFKEGNMYWEKSPHIIEAHKRIDGKINNGE